MGDHMATLEDVAALSGVSAMTVSRVINNSQKVSAKTIAKVEAVIQELNYRPNLVARGLATNRTSTVGILISYLENPMYSRMVSGVVQTASAYGQDVILGIGYSTESLMKSIDTLLGKQIDGLIVLPIEMRAQSTEEDIAHMASFYEKLERVLTEELGGRLPVISTEDYQMSGISGRVRVDYRGGAKTAVKYLYDNGHRKIGMICHDLSDKGIWNERYQGFLEAMEEIGCAVEEKYNCSTVNSVQGGFEAGMKLFSRSELPTAIYCANDIIASGVLKAAITCKLRVPEDISIIGHDGSLYSENTYPRLTTVSICPYEVGEACMEQLYALLNGRPIEKDRIISSELVKGESVNKII